VYTQLNLHPMQYQSEEIYGHGEKVDQI
jgi:hypothetical protein